MFTSKWNLSKWSGLLILLLNSSLTFAQENIKGIIKDKDSGEPVAGAVISVENAFYLSVSDKDGKFSFSESKENSLQIVVTHISYQTEKIEISKGKENVISLSRQTYLSEEVNISASRADMKQGSAFTNIDKKEIEKRNLGQDLPYLLNFTPSVVVTSDAGAGVGYSGIRIRGSDATRVNVTINGIPVNDAESHQVYWVDLPDIASSIENIQIQRGIGNSTNGAGAFGGSINILSNKVSSEPFGTISSSAGSFNTFKNTVMFGSGLISKSFAIEGRLSKISSDGYIDRASSDLHSFYLSGGYYGEKNSLRAVIFSGKEKTYQAWYGVPQDSLKTNRTYNPAGEYYDANGNVHYYDNQTDNYQQDYYQLFYSHVFNSNIVANIGLHYTYGRGYYEEYQMDQPLSDYNLAPITIGNTQIDSTDLIRQLWLSNYFYGLTWSVDYDKNQWHIKIGGALNWYDGDHFNKVIASEVMPLDVYPHEYYNDNAKKTDISAFVRTMYNVNEDANFFIDLQERFVDYTYTGISDHPLENPKTDNIHFFNPKAGINYNLSSKTQFYFSAGLGHKEPVRDDYINAVSISDLQSESMSDLETGIRFNSKKFSLSFNGYYMNYQNQLILTGKINEVGEYIRENVKDSYRAGLETEAAVNFTKAVNLKANATISNNKIKLYREYVDDYDGGPQIINEYKNTDISFSPALTGSVILGLIPFKNFNVDLTGKYVGSQFLDNTTNSNRKLDSYFINDAHISYSLFNKVLKEITFTLSLNNIFNTEYISNGYSYSGYSGGIRYDYNNYFPQAGFNFMGGVCLKL